MGLALEVDSVLHSFDDRTILSDVYLKCERGDIIGLFGRNGSGKSTLLKIIFGTLKGERAFIRIDGKVVDRQAMRTGKIVYVPQFNYLPESMSVSKVVKLSLDKDDLLFDDMFYMRTRNMLVGELSEGEQRYLAILIALESSAPYVMIDEPFKAIGPLLSDKIRKVIEKVSPDKGIIITDHNYREVHKIANRFMLLRDTCLFPITDKAELIKYGYYPKSEN